MTIERFSASVAGRHMSCHASANLAAAIPNWTPPIVDPDKGAKAEGTKKHAIFEDVWSLSATDIKHMTTAMQYVQQIMSTRRFKKLIEEKVQAAWLSTAPMTTPDLVLYTQDEMHIFDTKTGRIPVEVVENEQLLFLGVTLGPLAPKAKGITGHIVQPWADNIGDWWMTADRLAQFMNDAIATEAAIAAGSTQFGPSDHCKFCPANPHSRGDKGHPMCPAMLQVLYPNRGVDEDAILSL